MVGKVTGQRYRTILTIDLQEAVVSSGRKSAPSKREASGHSKRIYDSLLGSWYLDIITRGSQKYSQMIVNEQMFKFVKG